MSLETVPNQKFATKILENGSAYEGVYMESCLQGSRLFELQLTLFRMTLFVPQNFGVKTKFSFLKNTILEQKMTVMLIKLSL